MSFLSHPDLAQVGEYLHPEQKGRVLTGYKLFEFLGRSGLLQGCLSREELLALSVFGAEELRRHFRAPTLTAWGTVVPGSGGEQAVSVTRLFQDDLPTDWYPLSGGWADSNPAAYFV